MKVLTIQLDVSSLTDEEIKDLEDDIKESFHEELGDDAPILNIGVREIDPSDYEDEDDRGGGLLQ